MQKIFFLFFFNNNAYLHNTVDRFFKNLVHLSQFSAQVGTQRVANVYHQTKSNETLPEKRNG